MVEFLTSLYYFKKKKTFINLSPLLCRINEVMAHSGVLYSTADSLIKSLKSNTSGAFLILIRYSNHLRWNIFKKLTILDDSPIQR